MFGAREGQRGTSVTTAPHLQNASTSEQGGICHWCHLIENMDIDKCQCSEPQYGFLFILPFHYIELRCKSTIRKFWNSAHPYLIFRLQYTGFVLVVKIEGKK